MATIQSTPASSRDLLEPGSTVITGRLDKYILDVLPKDLLTVLRGVAFDELNAQITGGNLPSQVLVDGRSVAKRDINSARRSVSMRFADVEAMINAIRDAYNLLLRITRVQNPPKNSIVARNNFWLYKNGVSLGRLPGAFAKINTNTIDDRSVLRVVGPLVNYGRRLYWNPIGRSKIMNIRQTISVKGRETFQYDSLTSPRFKPYRSATLRKLANSKGGNPADNLRLLQASRPGVVEGTGQIVRRVLRRDKRYSGLYISDAWVSYPPAASWGKSSRNSRVPSVSVQMSRKGGLRSVNVL